MSILTTEATLQPGTIDRLLLNIDQPCGADLRQLSLALCIVMHEIRDLEGQLFSYYLESGGGNDPTVKYQERIERLLDLMEVEREKANVTCLAMEAEGLDVAGFRRAIMQELLRQTPELQSGSHGGTSCLAA